VSDDIQGILNRLHILERQVHNKVRTGRIAKGGVKKGAVRVELGGTSDGKPQLSPWIRTSDQNGFSTEHRPYEEGQTVMLISMDGDYSAAAVIPYSHADHDPLADDADTKRHTYRIRKPRKTEQQGEEGQSEDNASGGDDAGGDAFSGGSELKEYEPQEPEKQKDDDENDLMVTRNYGGFAYQKGKAKMGLERLNESEDGQDQQGGQQGGQQQGQGQQDKGITPGKVGDPDNQAGGGQKKDHAFLVAGNARVDVWDGQVVVRVGGQVVSKWTANRSEHKVGDSFVVITNGKVWTVGDTRLGSEDASRELALKDSIDSDGDTEVGNLSTKVKAI
jgi:hypothetical protein